MAKWLHISLFIISVISWASTYKIVPNPTSYIFRNDNYGPVNHQGAYYQEPVASQHLKQLPYPLTGAHAYEYNNYGPEHGGRPLLPKVIVPVDELNPKGYESEDGYNGNSAIYAYPGLAPGLYGSEYGHDRIIGSHDGGVVYRVPQNGYVHGDGGDFSVEKHLSNGDRAFKGYKSHENFKKGEESNYGSRGQEGHYNTGFGKKGVHYNLADQYGSQNSASKGYKNGDFGVGKSHNKGEKTTGFHNVYHKNEYKKDREFYDLADDSGHYKKHGGDASHHGAVADGYKKSGEGDSVYYQDTFGKNGFNKGEVQHDIDSGYNGKSGHDDYFNSHENFAKEAGGSHGDHHGYKGYSH